MEYPAHSIDMLIQNRRSVKPENYSAAKVDDAILHRMLGNAVWAPTHAMTQPWRFFVFTGQGLQKLADFQAELYKSSTPEAEFKPAKYRKLLETPLRASHIIFIGMHRQESGKIPETEEICAVACAVQNMQLTATAYGIASYWSTGAMTYHPAMKEYLGLAPADRCLGLVYVGIPAVIPPAIPRMPEEECTRWIR